MGGVDAATHQSSFASAEYSRQGARGAGEPVHRQAQVEGPGGQCVCSVQRGGRNCRDPPPNCTRPSIPRFVAANQNSTAAQWPRRGALTNGSLDSRGQGEIWTFGQKRIARTQSEAPPAGPRSFSFCLWTWVPFGTIPRVSHKRATCRINHGPCTKYLRP